GLSPEELAERMNRKKSLIYRLESEAQEPDAQYINDLVAILPLSADELCRQIGIKLNSPRAAKLPNQLVDLLIDMSPRQWQTVIDFLQMATQPAPESSTQA